MAAAQTPSWAANRAWIEELSDGPGEVTFEREGGMIRYRGSLVVACGFDPLAEALSTPDGTPYFGVHAINVAVRLDPSTDTLWVMILYVETVGGIRKVCEMWFTFARYLGHPLARYRPLEPMDCFNDADGETGLAISVVCDGPAFVPHTLGLFGNVVFADVKNRTAYNITDLSGIPRGSTLWLSEWKIRRVLGRQG